MFLVDYRPYSSELDQVEGLGLVESQGLGREQAARPVIWSELNPITRSGQRTDLARTCP